MEFLKGKLLIAAPQLGDSNFTRSVVLMLEHDEEGALGVVLNRPSTTSVREVWQEVVDNPCDCDQLVNLGGPVLGPLIAVHDSPSLSESEVMPGIYMATQRDKLDLLVRQDGTSFRLFSGYAGWGKGQLEGELEAGGWITKSAENHYIFCSEEDLWKKVGKDITDEVLLDALKIGPVPDDPSLN